MTPSEQAIAREMRETGFDRLPAIRRIQSRSEILRSLGADRRRDAAWEARS